MKDLLPVFLGSLEHIAAMVIRKAQKYQNLPPDDLQSLAYAVVCQGPPTFQTLVVVEAVDMEDVSSDILRLYLNG